MGDIGSLKSLSGIKHQVQPEQKSPQGLSKPLLFAQNIIQTSCKAYKNAVQEREKSPLVQRDVEILKITALKRKILGPPTYVPPKGNVSEKSAIPKK